MPLDAGKRDRRVVFLRQTKTQSGTGETVVAWVPAFSVWGRVIQRGAAEALRNGSTAVAATFSINVRWVAGLDTSYRIDLNGLILEIADVNERERRAEIEITAHRQT